jgi:hypothetical protein
MAGLQVVRLAPGKEFVVDQFLGKIAASGRLEWRCQVGDSGAAESVRPTFSILLQPRARSPHATRGKRHQGSTIFTHNDTMATELQVVMDPTVVGWETSFLLWRLEMLFWRCSTPGGISRLAAALLFSLSVTIARGTYCKPRSNLRKKRFAGLALRRL